MQTVAVMEALESNNINARKTDLNMEVHNGRSHDSYGNSKRNHKASP